jgi:hypothetical protein
MRETGQATPEALFPQLPARLRTELVGAYTEVVRNFRERRWEPAELNGGKLSEVTYSILKGYVEGTMPQGATKPRNMLDACRALERSPATIPRSIKVQIPRMLIALYEFRNQRNVGHVGGDVDPNEMDAICVLGMSQWVVAELVRVLHAVDTDEATAVVNALVERQVPAVWQSGDKRRLLVTGLSWTNQALLILYSVPGSCTEAELVSWLEHPSASIFRRDVLRKAHKARLLEYDGIQGTVELLPPGVTRVEKELPLSV